MVDIVIDKPIRTVIRGLHNKPVPYKYHIVQHSDTTACLVSLEHVPTSGEVAANKHGAYKPPIALCFNKESFYKDFLDIFKLGERFRFVLPSRVELNVREDGYVLAYKLIYANNRETDNVTRTLDENWAYHLGLC